MSWMCSHFGKENKLQIFHLMALKQYTFEVNTAVTDYNAGIKSMDLSTRLPTNPSTYVFTFCAAILSPPDSLTHSKLGHPSHTTKITHSHINQLLNFFLIKPTDALIFPSLFLSRNSACFGQFLCPSSGVFHCTFGTGICHAGLMTAFKHVHPGCAWKLSSDLYDIYQCWMYSGRLLMTGRGTAWKM